MGIFDDVPDVRPSPPQHGEQTLDFSRVPSGDRPRPSVPFSMPQTLPPGTFDDVPDATEAQKSVARIREVADKARAGSGTPGVADYTADALTLSTSRPISAAITAGVTGLTGSYPGTNYDERYKGLIQAMNERMAEAEKNTGPIAPVVGAVAQMPATMIPGAKAASLATTMKASANPVARKLAVVPEALGISSTAPASTAKVAGQSALQGAVEGASQHAGSVSDAVQGAATNAILSGGSSAALDKGMKTFFRPARRAAEAEATAARGVAPHDLKADAKTYFNQLDNQGIAYDAQQTAPLYTAISNLRTTHQYVPSAHKDLADLNDELLKLTRQGATFNQLHDIRSALAEQTRKPDASTAKAAGAMIREIDRMVNGSAPALNPSGANVKDAYAEARKLWRGASVAEDVGWIADKTERKQAIKGGVNPDEVTRANFGALEQKISKRDAYDPFDDEGRKLLSKVVRGDRVQNTQAAIGDTMRGPVARFAGGAAGLAAPAAVGWSRNSDPLLTVLLAAGGGASAAGGVNSLGKLFQGAAANRGQENVNTLLRQVTGSPKPAPGGAITRGDLAKILFAQDLERIAPRVGSQMIGTRREEQE